MKGSLYITLLLVFLLLGVLAFFYNFNFLGPCRVEVFKEASNPKGDLHAVVFVKNCGATSDYSTNVSILPATIAPTDTDVGNVYIAKGTPGQLSPSWKNDNTLRIEGHQAEVYRQEREFGGIAVSYSKQP